ncbi:hypothetical protein NW754_016727, partial [Fusarium falciforme]
ATTAGETAAYGIRTKFQYAYDESLLAPCLHLIRLNSLSYNPYNPKEQAITNLLILQMYTQYNLCNLKGQDIMCLHPI